VKRALLVVFFFACASNHEPARAQVSSTTTTTTRGSATPAVSESVATMNAEPAPNNESDGEMVVHMTDPKPTSGTPVVHVDQDTTMAGFYRVVIRRVLRQHVADLRACYARGLATKPDLAGRVALRFTIDPKGDVKDVASDAPTSMPADVATCVTGVIGAMKLPEPQGGSITIHNYRIAFVP
jgi:hypothetical protein